MKINTRLGQIPEMQGPNWQLMLASFTISNAYKLTSHRRGKLTGHRKTFQFYSSIYFPFLPDFLFLLSPLPTTRLQR